MLRGMFNNRNEPLNRYDEEEEYQSSPRKPSELDFIYSGETRSVNETKTTKPNTEFME